MTSLPLTRLALALTTLFVFSTVLCFGDDRIQGLQPPSGNSLLVEVKARGRQIYKCQKSSTGLAYSFLKARADLYLLSTADNNETLGDRVGHHFFLTHPDDHQGRATWALADSILKGGNGTEGGQSTVTGAITFSQLNVAPNVPSLLLKATSHTGQGPLSEASYIQRLNVHGGQPSSTNCSAEGRVIKIPYTSHYVMWTQDTTIPTNTPTQLQVPNGVAPMFAFYADGSQPYTFNGTMWNKRSGAMASLSSIPGDQTLGTLLQDSNHFTWSLANPSFVANGTIIATASIDSNSLDWALFNVTSYKSNGIPHINYVQMLSTKGGVEPTTTAGFKMGDTQASNFSAICWFYA